MIIYIICDKITKNTFGKIITEMKEPTKKREKYEIPKIKNFSKNINSGLFQINFMYNIHIPK